MLLVRFYESKLFNSHFPHTFPLRKTNFFSTVFISMFFFFYARLRFFILLLKDHLPLNKSQTEKLDFCRRGGKAHELIEQTNDESTRETFIEFALIAR